MLDIQYLGKSDMDENEEDTKDGITISLFPSNDKHFPNDDDDKHITSIKDNIFDDKTIYDKDNDEMYIATSPSFTSVDSKSTIVNLYDADHNLCDGDDDTTTKVMSECSEEYELHTKSLSPNTFATDSQQIEYSPIKASDDYPIINDTNYHMITSDNYHMSIDVSKTYFYVLSPTGGSAILRASGDEPLIHVDSDQLISVSNDETSKCLDVSDQVTPCMTTKHLSSDGDDDVIRESSQDCISEFDHHTSEHIDLVQTEIDGSEDDAVHGRFDNSGELTFINGIENDAVVKERSHLIWQPLSPGDEKHGEQNHSLLMKYDDDTKMETSVVQVQPYLHVALVNDMDASSTGEFVSTDQILGVTVPEIFSCKWEGCSTHTLTRDDLIKHVNTTHVTCDNTQNSYTNTNYTCYWKGCVRERKPFDARYKLVIHLRTHTGDKPHSCPMKGCEATFSRVENLKIHLRSHTGERPYPCQFEGCKKTFANSSDRFKHKRTHTEKKPYRCPIIGCEKSYTDPSSLRKHKKRHAVEGKKRNDVTELDRRKLGMEFND